MKSLKPLKFHLHKLFELATFKIWQIVSQELFFTCRYLNITISITQPSQASVAQWSLRTLKVPGSIPAGGWNYSYRYNPLSPLHVTEVSWLCTLIIKLQKGQSIFSHPHCIVELLGAFIEFTNKLEAFPFPETSMCPDRYWPVNSALIKFPFAEAVVVGLVEFEGCRRIFSEGAIHKWHKSKYRTIWLIALGTVRLRWKSSLLWTSRRNYYASENKTPHSTRIEQT